MTGAVMCYDTVGNLIVTFHTYATTEDKMRLQYVVFLLFYVLRNIKLEYSTWFSCFSTYYGI